MASILPSGTPPDVRHDVADDAAASPWPLRVASATGAYAVVAGLVTTVGWVAGLERLTDWKRDGIAMFPNTAACAVLCGIAILLADRATPRARVIVRVCGALAVLIAGLTLLEHLLGVGFGIDTLLIDRPWGQRVATAPMRMGPPASLSFLMGGAALLLATLDARARRASAALGTVIVAVGGLSFVGHLYGASMMYTLPRLTGIAMQTASVVLAVGLGILASLPEHEPVRTLLERNAAGALTRRAVPAIVAVALALGAARVALERQGLVDSPFGTALRTIVEVLLLTGLLWRAVARLRRHEQALQRSEAEVRAQSEQLAGFLDTAAIAIHRVGPDGTILWANDTELRMLGYGRDEYVGRPIAAFHVDDAAIGELLARLHRGERVHEYPARMRCKDGTVKDVAIDSNVVWDDGRFLHTQWFTRDVTASRRAEETQARLAAIVESSDDAIIGKDLDGVITSWNRAAERLFGYPAEEAIGRSVTMLIPAERKDEEPGILARIRRGEPVDHYETVRCRRDGTLLDISLTISPILDQSGRVVGASKIARDVTERKQAARRVALDQHATALLYEVGRRYARPGDHFVEDLGEMLDAAIWTTGADKGTVQLYDEATGALRLVAHRGFERPFVDHFASVQRDHAAVCAAALAALERVVVEDVTRSQVFAGQPSLGVLLDAGVRAVQSTPLLSSVGTILGVLSTHFIEPRRPGERECQLLDLLVRQAADYVERKRGEEQRDELLRATDRARAEAEAASHAKDEFLAMLGHELRNPLAAVRNAIAAATLDETSRTRALEIARRQTNQLARIVDDLLDVARITRGRVPLRKERAALADVLHRTVDGARALMDERGHVLTLELPAEPIHLEADAARLEQAIANLLTNAAKYTDPGGAVRVVAERDAGQAVVRVRDNGMGMAPEVLARVFDLFAQGERALDRAQGGLGIGLTLARRIVELHGGTIEATSPGAGGGSEFVVRLPALAPALDEATVKHVESMRRPRERHPARVLMAEDNPDAADSLVIILELLGHHVRVVHDGVAALEAARANVPDIMLVDIGLPGMNGYDVARAIRRDPSLKHVVLVALTGYGRQEDKAQAMAAGFDYHLVKPVDLDALGDLVTRVGSPAATGESETRH